MDLKRFEALPLMGILRGIEDKHIEPLVEAVVDAGLETIEITMNTADAPALIRKLILTARERLMVGAGTVLTTADLEAALGAGATFVVMPNRVAEVVDRCVAKGVPIFPGALTPHEVFAAHRAGATMVKVFPSNLFGPAYFKDLRGPFADIKLLACGGVTADNIGEFFSCGANAASFGGSVFKKAWLASGDFQSIRDAVKRLVQAVPPSLTI